MAKTRKKTIAEGLRRVLEWVAVFGISAVVMWSIKAPVSPWLNWFTLAVGALSVVANALLFYQPAQDRIVSYLWRRTRSSHS